MSWLSEQTKPGGLFGGRPKPADPYKLANAQSELNKGVMGYGANISAVSQFSPYGSTTFTRNAEGVPTAQTMTLSAPMQRQFDTTNATRQNLLNTAQGRSQTAWRMPDMARADQVADTMYARKWGMLKPEFERQEKAMDTSLQERGIPIGSEIYRDEQGRLGLQKSAAQEGLSQDAVLAAGAESDRLLRQSLAERAQPFNELTGFQGGTPIQTPNFQPTAAQSGSAPNLMGAVQTSDANALSQYNNQQSDFWGGLTGISRLFNPWGS